MGTVVFRKKADSHLEILQARNIMFKLSLQMLNNYGFICKN